MLCNCFSLYARLQEEAEASYKQYFPDHFNAFADVAELEEMPNLGDDSAAAKAAESMHEGLTDAEISSHAAQQLLHGELLSDLVQLHSRYKGSAVSTGNRHAYVLYINNLKQYVRFILFSPGKDAQCFVHACTLHAKNWSDCQTAGVYSVIRKPRTGYLQDFVA